MEILVIVAVALIAVCPLGSAASVSSSYINVPMESKQLNIKRLNEVSLQADLNPGKPHTVISRWTKDNPSGSNSTVSNTSHPHDHDKIFHPSAHLEKTEGNVTDHRVNYLDIFLALWFMCYKYLYPQTMNGTVYTLSDHSNGIQNSTSIQINLLQTSNGTVILPISTETDVNAEMTAFESRSRPQDDLVPILRSLNGNKIKSQIYSRVLEGRWNSPPFPPFILEVAYDIHNDEELQELRKELHYMLHSVMSPKLKIIQSRLTGGLLVLKRRGSNLNVGFINSTKLGREFSHHRDMIWRFVFVEQGKYFLLVDVSEKGMAVGVETAGETATDATQKELTMTNLTDSLKKDRRYHWIINFSSNPESFILVNRNSSLALNAYGPKYLKSKNGDASQDLKFVLLPYTKLYD